MNRLSPQGEKNRSKGYRAWYDSLSPEEKAAWQAKRVAGVKERHQKNRELRELVEKLASQLSNSKK